MGAASDEIVVRDHRKFELRYLFRPGDGELRRQEVSGPIVDVRPASGLCSTIGCPLSGKSIGVAVYVGSESLQLSVGPTVVDLLDPTVRVARDAVLPFVRRINVYRGERLLAKHIYCTVDAFDDPMSPRDIVVLVLELLRSKERRYRFIHYWKSVGLGDDPNSPAVKEKIERSVAAAMSSGAL
jgi:hypothetical protein